MRPLRASSAGRAARDSGLCLADEDIDLDDLRHGTPASPIRDVEVVDRPVDKVHNVVTELGDREDIELGAFVVFGVFFVTFGILISGKIS